MSEHQKLLNDIEQARVESAEQTVIEGLRAKGLLDDEPPAPRAGERRRNEWHADSSGGWGYVWQGGACLAKCPEPSRAQQIVTDHNQHATLIEQRQQLLDILRRARNTAQVFTTSKYLETAQVGLTQIVKDIDAVLPTIEQEGESQ